MDNVAIGNRIKSIRKSLGMTTEQFAAAFKENPPSKGTISKWENGHYLPNNQRIKIIAELGGIETDELIYGSYEEFCMLIFRDVESDLMRKFPIVKNVRYKKFFDNIDKLRERSILQAKKVRFGYNEEAVREFYYFRLVHDLPFRNTEEDRELYDYLVSKLGSYDPNVVFFSDDDKVQQVTHALQDILESDPSHDIHKLAFESTVSCFSEIDSDMEDTDLMTVYLHNLSYYEDSPRQGFRIDSKETYRKFLELRMKAVEAELHSDIQPLEKNLFQTMLSIDKMTLNKIK